MPMSLPEDLVEQARREREQQALSPITSSIDRMIREGMGGIESIAKGAAEQAAPVVKLLQGGELKLPTLDDLTPQWMRDQYEPKPVQQAAQQPAAPTMRQQPPAAASGMPQAMPTASQDGQPAQPAQRPMALPTGSEGGDYGPIDNSSRAAFVRTAYPYMLEAAGGDKNLAELMLAKAISENGDVGSGGGFIGNNFCYDGATEVLTSDGWVRWPDADLRHRFATLNPLTEAIEYQRASYLTRSWYSGRMFRVATDHVNLLVTPEHRMWVRPTPDAPYQIIRARDLSGRRVEYMAPHLPLGDLVHGANVDAEASCDFRSDRSSSEQAADFPYIGFGQLSVAATSAPVPSLRTHVGKVIGLSALKEMIGAHAGRVVTAMANLLLRRQRYGVRQCERETMGKDVLLAHAGAESSVPLRVGVIGPDPTRPEFGADDRPVFADLRPESLLGRSEVRAPASAATVAGVAALDGLRQGEKVFAASLADARNGTLLGHRLSPSGGVTPRPSDTRCGALRRKNYTASGSWTSYDGMVYCATVPNGLLVVRRDGKVVVSGNSGIKGEGDAGSFEADTWEDYGNGPVNIRDRFAAYSTPQVGFRAFMQFLHDNSRYAPALARYQQTGDASQLFRDIRAAGYATDPLWADKVENIRANQVAPIVRGQADQDMQRLSLNAAPAAAPGRTAPPAPAGVEATPAGATPAPWETAGASDGGPMLLKENDETAPMGGGDAMLPGDGGFAPMQGSAPGMEGSAAIYDARDADSGPRESRPAPILPTDPTVSDPAYTQNPNAAPMVDPLDPSTITPAALPPLPNGPRMMQPQAPYRDPREGQGIIARGIDAIGQYLPSAPIVDTKPGDAGVFMSTQPNTVGRLWEWRGRVAEGAADALSRGTGLDPDALVLNVEVGGIPIQMTVSELLENVTDPLLAAGWGVGDMVLDAAGKAVLRLVAPYAKGAARETIGRLLNSEPVQRGVEAVREGAEALGRGLQGVGREVAGGLMDLNPAMTPRVIGDGPGIGRSMPGPDDVPTPPAVGRPQQRTVEWLAEQIDYTKRVLDDLDPATEGELIGQVQDRLGRLQGEWVDAVNARRALEPRIRSEVGRRAEDMPVHERLAGNDYPMVGQERVSPEAGIPTTRDDTPRSPGLNSAVPFDPASAAAGGAAGAMSEGEDGEQGDPLRTAAGILLAGVGGGMSPGARRALQKAMDRAEALKAAGKADEAAQVVDAALRRTVPGYDPRLSREPVLPGMEPPRRVPGDAGPGVGNDPNLPGNRLGNVPPSQLREPTFPGMEGPYTRPNIPDVPETPNRAPVLGDVPPSAIDQHALPGMDPIRDVQAPGPVGQIDVPRVPNIAGVQRAVQRAQQRQAATTQPLSPLQWTRALAANIGYSSLIGPATATVNVFGNLLEPLWAIPKEITRAVVRGNPREAVEMAMGSFRGMADVGTAMVDAIMARGRYASNPDHPTLSGQTANPFLRALATSTEIGGRIFSGMPDAVFGTIARSAGEARRAAQIATDEGLKGAEWKRRVQTLLGEVEQFRKGELSLFPDQVDDIVKAGENYADSQTFRTQLGTVGRGAARLAGRDIPVVGNLLTPFFNTPWNMGVTLAERTPIGSVMNRQKGFDKAYDALVGSALLTGLVVGPAAAGNITGSGPNDPEQRKMLEAEGWKPYHTLIDGVYVPNRVFGIYGKLLNAVGEAHDAMAYQKKDGNVGAESLRRFGLLLKEEPYLQGLSDILGVINSPNASGVNSYAASTLTRMIPYAATARAIGTAMDPNERAIDSGKTVPWQETVSQRVQQGVGMRSGLPVAQDVLGRPKENPQQGLRSIMPALRDVKSEPLVRAYLDAGVDIGAPPDNIGGVPLTPRQQRQYQQIRGRELERLAGPTVARESWKTMPPQVRKQLLETFQNTARTLAEVGVSTAAGPEFARERARKTVEKATGQ